jgi:membrane-associated phospholipid phosphatase
MIQRPRTRSGTRRALALGATAAGAAAGLGALARATARRETAPADEAARERAALPPRHPARQAAAALAPLGTWRLYVPAALGVAAWLLAEEWRRPTAATAWRTARRGLRRGPRRAPRREAGALAVVASGALAAALGPAFDRWLPQPPAPPGHPERDKAVFPSGHTFGPTSVALTTAWVLARERRVPLAVALPAALAVPLVSASGKLMDQRHWMSDVLGGYLASAAVAGACLAAYEGLGDRR